MTPNLALSTHWNAFRHASGEAMVEEIRGLGFDTVELGYDLRPDLVDGLKTAMAARMVRVCSVHAFCPVPMGAPRGHPELFLLAEPDQTAREMALRHMKHTIGFAAEVGATAVVAHAGRVSMSQITPDLIRMAEEGRQFTARFDNLKVKLILRREKKAAACMSALSSSIEALLPMLDECRVAMAFENLPSLESVPSEPEMAALLERFNTPRFGYWHDTGHAVIRQRLGFAGQRQTLGQMGSRTLGMHVHGVSGFADDHLMPPRGELDVDILAPFAAGNTQMVLEPAPGTPPAEIVDAATLLRNRWRQIEVRA